MHTWVHLVDGLQRASRKDGVFAAAGHIQACLCHAGHGLDRHRREQYGYPVIENNVSHALMAQLCDTLCTG